MSTLATGIGRPDSSEYDPYYERYVSLVEGSDIIGALQDQPLKTRALFGSLKARADFRYAPGKWTVKEVLGHMNDTERIMTYRALRIGRGDKTPIEGFEQDDYVSNGRFDRRTLDGLIDEFMTIRTATVQLFSNFDAEASERWGTANQKTISARALGYTIAGHELHHRRIVQEKYLR
ncbi:MAG: DinB family protein [Terriglobales bacterium]|jgi:hypothetical protein